MTPFHSFQGKSHFYQTYLSSHGYVRVNQARLASPFSRSLFLIIGLTHQDELKTLKKVLARVEEILRAGGRCVVGQLSCAAPSVLTQGL